MFYITFWSKDVEHPRKFEGRGIPGPGREDFSMRIVIYLLFSTFRTVFAKYCRLFICLWTKDTTNTAKNKTSDAAQSAKDKTTDAAQSAKDNIVDATQSAKDKTGDATQSTKESAQQGKDQSAGFLQQVFYLYPSLIIKIYDRLCVYVYVYVYAIWFGASQCNFCLVTDRGTGEEHGSGCCGQCEEHTWNGWQEMKEKQLSVSH